VQYLLHIAPQARDDGTREADSTDTVPCEKEADGMRHKHCSHTLQKEVENDSAAHAIQTKKRRLDMHIHYGESEDDILENEVAQFEDIRTKDSDDHAFPKMQASLSA
jgi:hypothetical protein